MNKYEIVDKILNCKPQFTHKTGEAFAPSNIALCKYWGKRNKTLNLPVTSSLSISLGDLGTKTRIRLNRDKDQFLLNHSVVDSASQFAKRLTEFLDMFRPLAAYFTVETENNIPTAAGLASSASGYAALVLALDDLFELKKSRADLSVLARMGSGSACRSLYQGFVLWNRGEQDDGLDSHAVRLDVEWPGFCIGIVHVTDAEKPISSRDAMNRTVETSLFYQKWPERVDKDLILLRQALENKDFDLLGRTSESNAMAMHATMIETWPPVLFWQPETLNVFNKVWLLRKKRIPVYITIDAGPNVKLLFPANYSDDVRQVFSDITIIQPFG